MNPDNPNFRTRPFKELLDKLKNKPESPEFKYQSPDIQYYVGKLKDLGVSTFACRELYDRAESNKKLGTMCLAYDRLEACVEDPTIELLHASDIDDKMLELIRPDLPEAKPQVLTVDGKHFDEILEYLNDPPDPTAPLREVMLGENYKYKPKIEKARLDLIPLEVLYYIAAAFEDGALKRLDENGNPGYHNWESVGGWSVKERLTASLRHNVRLCLGEDVATDSGIPHAAHMIANDIMLLMHYIKGYGEDDR